MAVARSSARNRLRWGILGPGRIAPRIVRALDGNPRGQLYAVAGRVYEAAKAKGLGREIPTEWFLQDIRN